MTNNRNESTIETLVRRIVREEIRSMFSGAHSEQGDLPSDPQVFSDSSEAAVESRQTTGRRRRAGKGRVTKPNDRRLKSNRDQAANA